MKLVWDAGVPNDWRAKIDSAVAIARRSDVAIVVAGIEEGEFRDRASLALPGHQEALIRAVAATGKPTVVVLVGGSAITMPWLEDVGAVVDAWYPGEVGGTAVADVLFGDYNPAGRLPITFPVAEGQLPLRYNHKPTGPRRRLSRSHGSAAVPVRFGSELHDVRVRDLAIEPATFARRRSGRGRFTVKNTGQRRRRRGGTALHS